MNRQARAQGRSVDEREPRARRDHRGAGKFHYVQLGIEEDSRLSKE